MIIDGFALERISTGEQVAWWGSIPPRIDVPDTDVVLFATPEGWSDADLDLRVVSSSQEQPSPPIPPRKISKSIILSRLTDDQLSKADGMMTIRQKEKWRMPGHSSVSVEDTDLLDILRAIGANAAAVLAA